MAETIRIQSVRAARLAFKVAHGADEHLGWVKLTPDGSLYATDGVLFVRSHEAHDADMDGPLYVKLLGNPTFSKTAEAFDLDVEDLVLIEHRPRSEARHDVKVYAGDLDYPPVENLNPGRLADFHAAPLFDSIRAGRAASDYGMDIGVWGPSLVPDAVQLVNVDGGDLVVLAGIRVANGDG